MEFCALEEGAASFISIRKFSFLFFEERTSSLSDCLFVGVLIETKLE